ncbi:glucooligosaccharide oxidase-like protein [Mollisia scopiformis]|uniref:Glucooligosaccharide oxidase-like protein n=1 Tax=Mollisia scopiformis TaxID=149040 RepID=A0A194XNJ1_MOLSC|nr:glucooligosaccharide oxidase-like protein [Mollisia scopiformis]KUJ21674.1 glucooligosaccharide oxidase-like protein [Mollisia scopiformis]
MSILVSKFCFGILFAAAYAQATSVLDCLDANKVPYVTSSSTDWTAYQIPFNLRLPFEPAVITVPENEAQVSASITCAAAASLKVQAKGGGHSYASFSSGGQNGSLIIEMENFAEITVDPTTFIVKIGAGQRLGNIATEIYAQGKRAMPHGTCAGVGIAGHALHGGYGYDSRKWGLALDHVVGLDVVLADGTSVYTNATTNPDLFWAMRGAGDSFGIATNFYMQTEAAPESVLYFVADLSASLSSAENAATGFEVLQNWSFTSPDLTPNITFGTYADFTKSFIIRGWCMDCDEAVFTKSVFPGMLAGFPGYVPTVQNLDWITALVDLAGENLTQPLGHLYTEHDTFYAKSVVSKEAEPLSHASLVSYWNYLIANLGNKQWFSIINLYGAPGSLINAVSPDESAYSDRDSLWVFQNYGYTGTEPWDPTITPLIDGMNNATIVPQPDGDFGAYLNYVDPDLSPAEAHLEYYGASTYDKLLGLKAKFDPGFVFWNPQAIGTSMAL